MPARNMVQAAVARVEAHPQGGLQVIMTWQGHESSPHRLGTEGAHECGMDLEGTRCPYRCLSAGALQHHQKAIHRANVFGCPDCRQFICLDGSNYTKHVGKCSGSVTEACDECGRVFNRRDNLKRHVARRACHKRAKKAALVPQGPPAAPNGGLGAQLPLPPAEAAPVQEELPPTPRSGPLMDAPDVFEEVAPLHLELPAAAMPGPLPLPPAFNKKADLPAPMSPPANVVDPRLLGFPPGTGAEFDRLLGEGEALKNPPASQRDPGELGDVNFRLPSPPEPLVWPKISPDDPVWGGLDCSDAYFAAK
jgi:hypothetical protein